MKDNTFKMVLFWAFLAIFMATAVLVLLSVVGVRPIPDVYERWLFRFLICAVVGAMVTFWRTLTDPSFSQPPDVSGEWSYECIREAETCKHGGTCTIKVVRGPLGWGFQMQGKRVWVATKTDQGWKRKELEAQLSWENTWGAFTGSDALHYAYTVKAGENLIQGYGWAAIKKNQGGKPVLLEGNFFQLPPHDPFYGFQRYTRKG